VDSDGDLEMIVQSSDGTVHCYAALSARLLWQRQLSQPSLTLDLRLVDIDDVLHVVVAADNGLV